MAKTINFVVFASGIVSITHRASLEEEQEAHRQNGISVIHHFTFTLEQDAPYGEALLGESLLDLLLALETIETQASGHVLSAVFSKIWSECEAIINK